MWIWKFSFISVVLFGFTSCESGETSTASYTKDIPDYAVPCKVPTFVKILPISYRRQLRKIWSGVPMNVDCGPQLAATRELVNNLPTNLKLKIAEFGELENKFRANFFVELLPEEKVEFSNILKNMSLTAMEKADMLREWGRDRLSIAAFENFEEYLNVFLERDRKFQQKLEKLSSEARKAYDRIQEIRKEKQVLLARLSERAKKELASLFRADCGVYKPPSSRVQWDPVGAKRQEEREKENPDMGCSEVTDGTPLFGLEFAALTRSYVGDPPSTTPTPKAVPHPSFDPEVPSAGRRLFQLLLQRVQYLRPM